MTYEFSKRSIIIFVIIMIAATALTVEGTYYAAGAESSARIVTVQVLRAQHPNSRANDAELVDRHLLRAQLDDGETKPALLQAVRALIHIRLSGDNRKAQAKSIKTGSVALSELMFKARQPAVAMGLLRCPPRNRAIHIEQVCLAIFMEVGAALAETRYHTIDVGGLSRSRQAGLAVGRSKHHQEAGIGSLTHRRSHPPCM